MGVHSGAGKPAPRSQLVDVDRLMDAYFTERPDPAEAAQRVAFGTSGHRGSSLRNSFNQDHILAITQAICDIRIKNGVDGPLFLGMDTHALSADYGEHTISNVKFEDGKLTYTRKSKINDFEFESTFEGTIKGHKLAGAFKSQRGEIPATGERVGAPLIGKWELTTTSERGTRTSMLTIFGDMTGRYESFGGEIPIKDLKLQGDQVTFVIEMGFGDQTFKMDFKGKLDGTTLNGERTTSRGTSEFTGKKVKTASPVVGTWQFTRETSRGTRTSTLKIKEDMTGTYTSRDNEVAVTDLKVDGDQVSFKITRSFGEREFTMEFKGKVDGTTLKGEFTTSRGSREATGKKID
jgi:hypothetical protein